MRAATAYLLVLLAVGACGEEDRSFTDITPANDEISTSADDSPARLAPATPGPDTILQPPPSRGSAALPLAPLGSERLRGSVQALASGSETSFAVTLAQGHPGTTYAGAVRQGSCAAMGPTVASLNPVSAGTQGAGTASSEVAVPLDSLLKRPHVVVYGKGGRPQACGALPSRASAGDLPDTVRS